MFLIENPVHCNLFTIFGPCFVSQPLATLCAEMDVEANQQVIEILFHI
jgi:hypothetical protein